MDVVRAVNDANLILPAGNVRIGPLDYSIYTNSQFTRHRRDQRDPAQDRRKSRSRSPTSAMRRTPQQIQNNIVRVDGQPSVYLPVLKQGGDTNTIAVVDASSARSRTSSMFPRSSWRRSSSISRSSSRQRSRRCCTKARSACS